MTAHDRPLSVGDATFAPSEAAHDDDQLAKVR